MAAVLKGLAHSRHSLKDSPGSSLGGGGSSISNTYASSSSSNAGQRERIPAYGANFEQRLPEYFAIFQTESNIQIVAERLEAFFNDVYAQPIECWAQLIQETLLFQVLAKPLIIEALLYGDRIKIGRFHPCYMNAKQDWFRPLLRMINVVGLEGVNGVKWSFPQEEELLALATSASTMSLSAAAAAAAISSPLPTASSALTVLRKENSSGNSSGGGIYENKAYEITDQLLLISVTILNWVFFHETSEQFHSVLEDVKTRFENVGWTAVNSSRFGCILKGLTTKILRSGVNLIRASADSESCWENIVVLTNVIEDFSFYSPICGFKRGSNSSSRQEGGAGVHIQPRLDAKGCPDKELFHVLDELLKVLDVIEKNVLTPSTIMKTPAQKKRKEFLVSASFLFSEATKWGEIIGECTTARAGDEDEKMIYDRILDQAATELVEALSKRPRFKSNKKQVAAVFASAAETVLKAQEAEVVTQVGEGRIREGVINTNWAELTLESLDKQTKAGGNRLRRTVRFLQATLEAHLSFTQALEKLNHKDEEEDSKPLQDGMSRFAAASDLLSDLNCGLTNQTRLFVSEVQTLVINPFIELQNEYERGVNKFKEMYAKEEKAYEGHWQTLLKDFEMAEKDFQELTLYFFEVESAGKGRDAALAKLPKLMQRVVNRFYAYEKVSQDFEQVVTTEHRQSLDRLCQELQDVEIKRLECTQLYLERLTYAFTKFNDGLPQLKYCYDELRALSVTRDLGRFSMKSPRRVREERLPPKLPYTAAGLLAGEGGQGTSPLRNPGKKHAQSSSTDSTDATTDLASPEHDLEDRSEHKKRIWQGMVEIMKDVKAPSFLNIKRLASPIASSSSTTPSASSPPLPENTSSPRPAPPRDATSRRTESVSYEAPSTPPAAHSRPPLPPALQINPSVAVQPPRESPTPSRKPPKPAPQELPPQPTVKARDSSE